LHEWKPQIVLQDLLMPGGIDGVETIRRIAERMALDTEKPPVSAGVGMAIYPQDGETIDALMGCADQQLYRMKGRTPRKLAMRR
jgi:GGDEF domain-containing protein